LVPTLSRTIRSVPRPADWPRPQATPAQATPAQATPVQDAATATPETAAACV
jgi:hypothetical protein